MYKCNVCKKEYSSISSLNHHQKTATFCIKLQTKNKETNNIENSEQNNEDENNLIFSCDHCKKEFNTKFKLISHQNNCKQKEISDIKKEYELKIESLCKEYELKIELLNKENKAKMEANEKLINKYEEQIKIFIDKTTSNVFHVNNIDNINSLNIREEEINKNFLYSLI